MNLRQFVVTHAQMPHTRGAETLGSTINRTYTPRARVQGKPNERRNDPTPAPDTNVLRHTCFGRLFRFRLVARIDSLELAHVGTTGRDYRDSIAAIVGLTTTLIFAIQRNTRQPTRPPSR